jgi:hypothetical protein
MKERLMLVNVFGNLDKQKYGILIISLIQGLVIYLLNKLYKLDFTTHKYLLTIYASTVLITQTIQLNFNNIKSKILWCFIGIITLISIITGIYSFSLTIKTTDFTPFTFLYLFTMYSAWFIALPFIQALIEHDKLFTNYKSLYTNAWRNFLLLFEAFIFLGLFWISLSICSSLFKLIGIKFFSKLFSKNWFIYIASSLAYGMALYSLQTNESTINTVQKHLLAILKKLLPLMSFIAVLFIIVLPFKGLNLLFATKHASTIILSLIAFMVILINTSYQDGNSDENHNKWINNLIKLAILSLPIYSVIAIYAVCLRVNQYGWAFWRVWGAVLIAIASIYSFGYALSLLYKRNDLWKSDIISKTNIINSLIIISILVLINTPILNPARITVTNQIQRLLNEKVGAKNFDFSSFKFELGKLGIKKLVELSKIKNHKEADIIREEAKKALNAKYRYELIKEPLLPVDIKMLPSGKIEQNFIDKINNDRLGNNCRQADKCFVIAIDLNADNVEEYVLFTSYMGYIFKANPQTNDWIRVGDVGAKIKNILTELKDDLEKGNFKAVPNNWYNLQIGDKVYPTRIE